MQASKPLIQDQESTSNGECFNHNLQPYRYTHNITNGDEKLAQEIIQLLGPSLSKTISLLHIKCNDEKESNLIKKIKKKSNYSMERKISKMIDLMIKR